MRIAIVFFTLVFSVTSSYALDRTFTFEDDELNKPPKGIVIDTPPPSQPLAVVQKDEKADQPNKILALAGSRFPGVNFFSGIVYFSNVQDGKLSIRFKHTGEPRTIRTIGLMWRKTDTQTYGLDFDTAKSRISISKHIKGKRDKFEEEKIIIPAGEWHTLSVEFKEDEIHGFIDDKEVIKGKDDTITEPGKVGFFVQSDTIILADDFKVQGEDAR